MLSWCSHLISVNVESFGLCLQDHESDKVRNLLLMEMHVVNGITSDFFTLAVAAIGHRTSRLGGRA